MSVMIARDHHHLHPGARNLAHRECEGFFADAAGIEKVADDQQQVNFTIVGDRDHLAERIANSLPDLLTLMPGAIAVALEVHVRGVEQSQRPRRNTPSFVIMVYLLYSHWQRAAFLRRLRNKG